MFISSGLHVECSSFIVFALSKCCTNMSLKPLHHVLSFLDIPFDVADSLNQLRRRLHVYVSQMQKTLSNTGSDHSWRRLFADLAHTSEHWPQMISLSAKEEFFAVEWKCCSEKRRMCLLCGTDTRLFSLLR